MQGEKCIFICERTFSQGNWDTYRSGQMSDLDLLRPRVTDYKEQYHEKAKSYKSVLVI